MITAPQCTPLNNLFSFLHFHLDFLGCIQSRLISLCIKLGKGFIQKIIANLNLFYYLNLYTLKTVQIIFFQKTSAYKTTEISNDQSESWR
jgi:hypothetical protein